MYALLFTLYLTNGQQLNTAVTQFPTQLACEQQALRYHVGMNKIPTVLGTEHRCLIVVPEVDEK